MKPLSGRVGLPTNIRPGWKGLPGTNALAYYEKALLTAIKSFISLAPGHPSSFQFSLMFAGMLRPVRDKHSSFLQTFVNNDDKKFYNIGPRMMRMARENTDFVRRRVTNIY